MYGWDYNNPRRRPLLTPQKIPSGAWYSERYYIITFLLCQGLLTKNAPITALYIVMVNIFKEMLIFMFDHAIDIKFYLLYNIWR